VNFPTQFRSLYGDRGYDSANCRSIAQGHGLDTVIPRRRSGGAPARVRGVVEEQEATRYVVEQTFGIFDLFRRLKVRYDGLASTFKSFHFMAAGLIVGQRMGKQVKSA
jgi:IS5 family transposase